MNPIQVEGPAVEPVALADMKAHLRVDHDAEDALIEGLTKAARLMVEAASRRLLVEQTWRVALDRWPETGTLLLPLSPLIAVESITFVDASGGSIAIPPERIDADAMSDPPRIAVSDPPQPGRARNGIVVTVRAGYGAAPGDVPATLRLAIKIIVARWFENRGDLAGDQTLPPDALAMIAPFRRARL
ncbi:head-tail connector protein [Microvirga subterranea]|uniref:Putative phiE125 gp8 family phage protein n=1 Tax=Microvirga subterranea TaxID=186651 RepID=A0A370HJN0_9HYPH|nr:head-tail connector protein [Microvirga subterranea]RDI58718.1 putative phiE125 gp8 family phage protein [Microvirga subterranea]